MSSLPGRGDAQLEVQPPVELDDGRESFADIDAVLATLHGYATDRGRLATHGRRAQDDAYALWGADAMLEPIWRHLESCVFPEAPMEPSCSDS